MVQKVIRIGSSAGVTIPKKQLEELGIVIGDKVKLTIEPVSSVHKHKDLLKDLESFMDTYDHDLRNLAKR